MIIARAKKTGPLYFVHGFADQFHRRCARHVCGLDMAQHVFDHHYGAVDDHSEIERAKREEIRGHVAQIKANGGEEQRKGNGQDDDQRRPDIAEEEKQNDRDQQDSFGQIVHHRVRSEVNQVAAVEEGHNFYSGRQEMIVQIVDFLVQCRKHCVAVGAFAQQDDAFDVSGLSRSRLFAVDGLARSVLTGSSALE